MGTFTKIAKPSAHHDEKTWQLGPDWSLDSYLAYQAIRPWAWLPDSPIGNNEPPGPIGHQA